MEEDYEDLMSDHDAEDPEGPKYQVHKVEIPTQPAQQINNPAGPAQSQAASRPPVQSTQ